MGTSDPDHKPRPGLAGVSAELWGQEVLGQCPGCSLACPRTHLSEKSGYEFAHQGGPSQEAAEGAMNWGQCPGVNRGKPCEGPQIPA